jgi:hypothetical protein
MGSMANPVDQPKDVPELVPFVAELAPEHPTVEVPLPAIEEVVQA